MDGQYVPICTDENFELYNSLNLLALGFDGVRGRWSTLQAADLKIRARRARGIGCGSNGAKAGKDQDGWNRIWNSSRS